MKQPKIEDIIKLNEINCYLTRPDLIKLGYSCKEFRKLLISKVFSSFNFREFVINGKYKSDSITEKDKNYEKINKLFNQHLDNEDSTNTDKDKEEERFYISDENSDGFNGNNEGKAGDGTGKEIDDEDEDSYSCKNFSDGEEEDTRYIQNPYRPLPKSYLESKAKFQSDIKQISYQPTKLSLFNIEYYDYLLYDLPNVFLYVKSLIIKDSSIQPETFQYLLDSLSKLEEVELLSCYLKYQESDDNANTLNFPLSLKKLTIYGNFSLFTSYRDDYIDVMGFDYLILQIFGFALEPKLLPNLHTLAVEIGTPGLLNLDGYDENCLKFLKANSHIKKLEIRFDLFNLEFFEIISRFYNLTELKLSIYKPEDIESFKGIKSPALANLKNLSLSLYSNISILSTIAEQFPSIAKLNLTCDFGRFCNIGLLKLLPYQIQAFKSLKVLKLKIFVDYKLDIINFSKLKNLKSLEILWRKLDDIEDFMKNLEACPNLKNAYFNAVKFEEYEFHHELSPELLQGWQENNWTILKLKDLPSKLSD